MCDYTAFSSEATELDTMITNAIKLYHRTVCDIIGTYIELDEENKKDFVEGWVHPAFDKVKSDQEYISKIKEQWGGV